MNQDFDLPPDLQPPMANGEIVFESPWQSRVFGMAVALSEQGHFTWAEFQQQLIRYVGVWDQGEQQTEYQYFDHFGQALLSTLAAKQVLDPAELEVLVAALRERPHGHDHPHPHNHSA